MSTRTAQPWWHTRQICGRVVVVISGALAVRFVVPTRDLPATVDALERSAAASRADDRAARENHDRAAAPRVVAVDVDHEVARQPVVVGRWLCRQERTERLPALERLAGTDQLPVGPVALDPGRD